MAHSSATSHEHRLGGNQSLCNDAIQHPYDDLYINEQGPSLKDVEVALDTLAQAEDITARIDAIDTDCTDSIFDAELRQLQIVSVIETNLGSRWSQLDSILREPCVAMSSDRELESTFQRLRDIEPALSGRPTNELVRTSGSLTSRVGIKLHYPTFCTAEIQDGESADFDSPCSRVLLRKGLTPETWFWSERSCRREKRMDKKISPIDTYEPDIAAQHEQFELWCDRNAAMKIQLICGMHNWRNLRRRETSLNEGRISFARRDFDTQDDLTVTICWSKTRIYVLAYHPEWFLHAVSGPAGQLYDLQINTAVALANIHSPKRILIGLSYFARLGFHGNNIETNFLLSRKNAESDYAGIRQYANERRGGLKNEERTSIKVCKDEPIKLRCMSCKGRGVTTIVLDQQPSYMTQGQHAGKYVAKRRVCQVDGCCPPFEKNPSRRRIAQFNPLDFSIKCVNDGEIGRKRPKNFVSKTTTTGDQGKRKIDTRESPKITSYLVQGDDENERCLVKRDTSRSTSSGTRGQSKPTSSQTARSLGSVIGSATATSDRR